MKLIKATAAASLLVLAACGGNTIPDPDPDGTVYGSDSGSDADTFGSGDDGMSGGGFVGDDSNGMSGELTNVIYFEFDSSEVSADSTDVVLRHAMQLADDQRLTVRLEGHADERGSREYNIGLGERRAQAVRQILLLQGATPAQISTVSFGEERPADFGSDESAYALNRRVVFTYTN
ncbi:MAG: peptidoglycan-associated lipoprotein Pal [Woeseiaceae bacterium]|nr:peptidoglycan-associated lipoprotein Pal [Woeseiaceae bacterium]